MAQILIEAKDLEVTYNVGKSNEFKALKGVDVEVCSGEYIILFGTSGSGKSTLMNCILGSLPNSGGYFAVKGEEVYKYTVEEMVYYQQVMVGIMFQTFNLIPSLTVLDNVALPQIFASQPIEKRQAKAQDLLDRFGVGHTSHKVPTNLSGGQQQRVSVARSLVNDPEILLCDEPVGNLDSRSATDVMNTIEEVNQRDGKTIILVTHDAKHLPYAHRVYYLQDGEIIREVPNPEKEQIKEVEEPGGGLVSEIEHLTRLFPYVSLEEVRVKSLINFLTQDINFDQVQALEKVVYRYICGTLSDKELRRVLRLRLENGGVGVEEPHAREMARELSKLMQRSQEVSRFRKLVKSHSAYYRHKYIKRLRRHLEKRFELKLSDAQKRGMNQALTDRLMGILRKEDFKSRLRRSTNREGAGLKPNTTRAICDYLEKLIAQGVAFEKHKH